MEEEDEDKILLSSLGIASANQEDIERKILSEAKSDSRLTSELGGSSHELDIDDKVGSSSANQTNLYNRLYALEVEIHAVASSVEKSKLIPDCASLGTDDISITEAKCREDVTNPVEATTKDVQHALAKDRLRSLKQAKAKLLKQISKLGDYAPNNDTEQEKRHKALLVQLVKDDSKPKKKPRNTDQPIKDSKRSFAVVSYDEDADFDAVLDGASAGFMETERDKLVRKGILTPFHKLKGFERRIQQPEPIDRLSNHDEDPEDSLASASIAKAVQSMSEFALARPTTKLLTAEDLPRLEAPTRPFQRLKAPLKRSGSPTSKEKRKVKRKKRPLPDKRWRNADSKKKQLSDDSEEDPRGDSNASDEEGETQDGEFEDEPSVVLDGGLKIPGVIYTQLFDYQKVGVQWLWELHCQRAGGIIGDEMGLGKTIQVIAFLGALHFSNLYKPSIVVCPVTLLQQWKREVRKWYPEFRVEILHDSAHAWNRPKKSNSDESDYDSEASLDNDTGDPPTKSLKKWNAMIDRVVGSEKGLLLTTYEQLRLMGENLLNIEWGYAVLDEGHRIRNPNAEVTLVCKQLQTVHRIIMTGAPIQNKLSELWSLFDFVFPGKLGVLPVFESEFAVPIKVGGYANATPLQVSTAYRCAVVLRDLVMPYLLRRMKSDVDAQLPKKTEHVLFCSLTSEQRSVYRAFLASSEVEQIFDGSRNSLYGIDVMRKICNHPDLLEREHAAQNPDYGNPERSGKMKVVSQVLKVWKEQGHRVLLFAQTQQMLDIIQTFLAVNGYVYRRMDGVTPVKQRMALIDEFNNSDDIFIFILTTKVGGLGTNLTGANRVIIYDPDWNPSTDMQARERAWRIGQKRDVTVYRLITRGTIEEKVYHRQIYKHFLSNKILKNPQQRRFFKARDMKDLFTLQDDQHECSTETSNIFRQLVEEIKIDNQGEKELTSSMSTEPDSSTAQMNSSGAQMNSSGPKEHASSIKGKEKIDQNIANKDEETNILQSLFDAHGFHSAMNHDEIMNAHDDDKLRMEEQATQVAQRAAQALRESRMLRSRESFAVPTWTGRAGAAGAPSSIRKRFGSAVNGRLVTPPRLTEGSTSRPPGLSAGISTSKALSSAELLARIKGTQERAADDALEQEIDLASTSNRNGRIQENGFSVKTPGKMTIAQPEVLIRQLCTFIQKMGGYADSFSITQHFKDRIQSKDLPLFKNLLKEIASLEKDANGSRWVLKPDYQ